MQERFTALADILSSGSYDVVVLQEVWLEQYYNIIKDAMPYVSPFRCVYVHFSKIFIHTRKQISQIIILSP